MENSASPLLATLSSSCLVGCTEVFAFSLAASIVLFFEVLKVERYRPTLACLLVDVLYARVYARNITPIIISINYNVWKLECSSFRRSAWRVHLFFPFDFKIFACNTPMKACHYLNPNKHNCTISTVIKRVSLSTSASTVSNNASLHAINGARSRENMISEMKSGKQYGKATI